jgi:hypothetical protein
MTRAVTKAAGFITFLLLQLLLVGISRGQDAGDACSNGFPCEGGKMLGTIPDCFCPIDQKKLPEPPNCEANWECVTDVLVGTGKWASWWCVERDSGKRPGGGGKTVVEAEVLALQWEGLTPVASSSTAQRATK